MCYSINKVNVFRSGNLVTVYTITKRVVTSEVKILSVTPIQFSSHALAMRWLQMYDTSAKLG